MVRKASTYTLEEARQLVFEHAEDLLREYAQARGTAAMAMLALSNWTIRLAMERAAFTIGTGTVLAEALRAGRVTGHTIIDEADRIAARIIGVDSLDPDRATGLRFKARQSAIARRNVERSELANEEHERWRAWDAELKRELRRERGNCSTRGWRALELIRRHGIDRKPGTVRKQLNND